MHRSHKSNVTKGEWHFLFVVVFTVGFSKCGHFWETHCKDAVIFRQSVKPSSKVGSLGVVCLVLMLWGVARVVAKEGINPQTIAGLGPGSGQGTRGSPGE